MKPNVIVALLVGAALGFGLGRVVSPASPSAAPSAAPVAAAPARPTPNRPAAPRPPPPANYKKVELAPGSPSFGPEHAKVTIVEWSDFECPYCQRGADVVRQIKEAYPNDVKLIFRHQPLNFHKNARPAALASMAAHEQGKFWEYHDKLFANRTALDQASLEKYAQELGLNMAKFKAAMANPKYAALVDRDASDGVRVGASGTPTFYVNGREVVGAQPFETFKQIIDQEKARAEKLLAQGTKMEELYTKLLNTIPEPPKAEVGEAPTKGPKNAPVTVIEWSDFECPYCQRGADVLKQIGEKYGDKVQIAFKHQPLSFHKNAQIAAEASMAAHEQGKFWEYHDKLFANRTALDRPSLEKYAKELGLNMAKFTSALDSGKFREFVQKDAAAGMGVGATGTPTFFVNGQKVSGAQPIDVFSRIIDAELAKAKK